MSFLRISVFVWMLIALASTSYNYAETKSAPHQKPRTQVSHKNKPVQRVRTGKKSSSVRKKPQPVKNNIQPKKVTPPPAQGTQKPKPPGITVAEPIPAHSVAPIPNVIPKVVPPVAQPAQVPTQTPTPTPAPNPINKDVGHKEQRLIVLDPGHGGYDLGARMSACDEKSLALSTALLTKKYLTEMGYRVILTRSRDVFMPLEKRALIANETRSKLFVSIHYNAAKNPIAKGIEVFYYASADKFRTGSSKKLAARVLNRMIDKTASESRGIKEGNFYVIRETKMPAILIEAGFMTHPEELHLLKDINYRDKIARGIAEGIDSFFRA